MAKEDKTKMICVKKEESLLFFSQEDVCGAHDGTFPAGVALAYQLFQCIGQLEREAGRFILADDAYFYSGIGVNGAGILDVARFVLDLKDDHLCLDLSYADGIEAPAGPGGGKYVFEAGYDGYVWQLVLRDGLIPASFFSLSKEAHEISAQRALTAAETDRLMQERTSLARALLSAPARDLFRVKKIGRPFSALHPMS